MFIFRAFDDYHVFLIPARASNQLHALTVSNKLLARFRFIFYVLLLFASPSTFDYTSLFLYALCCCDRL